MEEIYDVIIAGCGPTGATFANYFGKQNLKVLIFDKEENVIDYPRAVHIDEDVIRIFQELGLYEAMKENSIKPFENYSLVTKKDKLLFQFQPNSSISENIADCNWILQPEIEVHLRNGFAQYPNVNFLNNTTWENLIQKKDSVSLSLINSKKESLNVKAKFLIACDGGKSEIRKKLKIDLHDFGFKKEWFVIDTKYKGNDVFSEDHKQYCDTNQPTTYVNGVADHFRWEFMLSKKNTHLQEEALSEMMISRLSPGFPIQDFEIIRNKKYIFHTLIAKKWRSKTIFLAGDAAHQMPPFLGQGMCSGIKDAKNLSWKIIKACSKSNTQIEELLDSYHKERAPQVEKIIKLASVLGGFIQCTNPVLGIFRNGFLRFLNILPSKPIDVLIDKHLYSLNIKNFSKTNHPMVGRRIPQPIISLDNDRNVHFDELCGFNWVILFRSECKIRASNPMGKLKYIPLVENVADSSIGITSAFFSKWMNENNADFVVIRPDKFIFEIGKAKDYDKVISDIDSYINVISSN